MTAFEVAIKYMGIGALAGTLAGLLGIGGGALLVPFLIIVLKFPTKQAVAISLSSMVLTATFGAIAHFKEGNLTLLNLRYALLIGLGAAAGAVLGAHLSTKLPAPLLRRLLALFLIIMAVRLALGPKKGEGLKSPTKAISRVTTADSSKPSTREGSKKWPR